MYNLSSESSLLFLFRSLHFGSFSTIFDCVVVVAFVPLIGTLPCAVCKLSAVSR